MSTPALRRGPAVAAALVLIAVTPGDLRGAREAATSSRGAHSAEVALAALMRRPAVADAVRRCRVVVVSEHRPVPQLSYLVAAEGARLAQGDGRPTRGVAVMPAPRATAARALAPGDRPRLSDAELRGTRTLAGDAVWTAAAGC